MKHSGKYSIWKWGLAFAGMLAMATAAEDVKPLTTFPKVDRLWLGIEEGVIRPAGHEQVRATADGYVELFAKNGEMIEKGMHWGTLAPRLLELEKRGLEVDEKKHLLQLRKLQDDARNETLRLGTELHEAERSRMALEEAMQDPLMPAAIRDNAATAIDGLVEQISILRARITPEARKQAVELEVEDLELQMERKRRQYRHLEKQSLLIAGFSGELRFGDKLHKALADTQDAKGMVWLSANDLVGTLVNEGSYEIVVPAASALISGVPVEQLQAYLQDGQTGRLIVGTYDRAEEVDKGGEVARKHVFVITDKSITDAKYAVGSTNLVHLYRKFNSPFRLVFKKDIAFAAPEVLNEGGWSTLVRHLWKGSQVLHVGPQAIAVAAANED